MSIISNYYFIINYDITQLYFIEILKLLVYNTKNGGVYMKLMYIIVRQDNEADVVNALIAENFRFTKLATSGGFLRKGNTTLFSCVEDSDVDKAIEIVKSECGERQKIQVEMPINLPSTAINYTTIPTTIEVGGATIIVTDVYRFERF